MNVRSITIFAPRPAIPTSDELRLLASLATETREALTAAGFTVQTVRLALSEWTEMLGDEATEAQAVAFAREIEALAGEMGADYVALGPVRAAQLGDLTPVRQIPAMLAATEKVFATVELANHRNGINIIGARVVAETIKANAQIEPNGFGNLRFAALANVPPGSPFFPAAHADRYWQRPAFALALESADLAMRAYTKAPALSIAAGRLIVELERAAEALVAALKPVTERDQADFLGLDFSLAPFPTPESSAAGAIEALGASPFGAAGTLMVAALTTEAIHRAKYPRCGFSGLMLPVLEDTTLAARAGTGSYDIHSLLLFSAVCGTGLDTIPLPGDIPDSALAGLLLDTCALALRLNKPLTARLMPIPGKQAGEQTTFDFPFFANSTILSVIPPSFGPLYPGGEKTHLRPVHGEDILRDSFGNPIYPPR